MIDLEEDLARIVDLAPEPPDVAGRGAPRPAATFAPAQRAIAAALVVVAPASEARSHSARRTIAR